MVTLRDDLLDEVFALVAGTVGGFGEVEVVKTN